MWLRPGSAGRLVASQGRQHCCCERWGASASGRRALATTSEDASKGLRGGGEKNRDEDGILADADKSFAVLRRERRSTKLRSLIRQQPHAVETSETGESVDEDAEQERDRHLYPQHRRYLTQGDERNEDDATPSERVKRRTAKQLTRSLSAANEYRRQRQGLTIAEQHQHELDSADLLRPGGGGLLSNVEEQIEVAIMKGDFENLPGKGKKLDYEFGKTPGVDSTTAILHRTLARQGFKPPFVEKQGLLEFFATDLRSRIVVLWCDFLLQQQQQQENEEGDGQLWQKQHQQDRLQAVFSRDVERVLGDMFTQHNALVDSYNLEVPNFRLARPRATIAREVLRCVEQHTPSSADEARTLRKTHYDAVSENYTELTLRLRMLMGNKAAKVIPRDISGFGPVQPPPPVPSAEHPPRTSARDTGGLLDTLTSLLWGSSAGTDRR